MVRMSRSLKRRSPVRKSKSPKKTLRKSKSPKRTLRKSKSPKRTLRKSKSPKRTLRKSPSKKVKSPKSRVRRSPKASKSLRFAFHNLMITPRQAALEFLDAIVNIVDMPNLLKGRIIQDNLHMFTEEFKDVAEEGQKEDEGEEDAQEYREFLQEMKHHMASDGVRIIEGYIRTETDKHNAFKYLEGVFLELARSV